MDLLSMHVEFKAQYPDISKTAGKLHLELWDEITSETVFIWFESLANALNREMLDEIDAKKYKALFEFFREHYFSGDNQVKSCIDVSFVENLFWNVPASKAKNYWIIFPEVLKELYVNFHGREPI
ncbi:DUF7674 family protein [Deefgea rivuli]|uniref:DUF7674 family protein n=1 Tax=Deefgea rivuli TaxID=400948 RepID=UPI0004814F37|nr:hypothetical protein [Deefgea rivuli]